MNRQEIEELANSMEAKIKETHISWILLTKEYAYKIKKPAKTTFLDFSTLSLRKHFCEEELKLNREYSKDVYKSIVTINKDKIISINGEGEAIDYAVQMIALNNKKRLDVLLKKNKVSKKKIKNLAHTVAAIHEKAKPCDIDKLPSLLHEYEDLLNEMLKSPLVKEKEIQSMKRIYEKITCFIDEYSPYFKERQSTGMIREVHGDLHSGNIFLYKQPILFDRIEFNQRFRTIDVLNEIAFLCTDLEFLNHKKLSKVFLNTYLKELTLPFGDEEKNIFIFYKSYTANIRAKVNLLLAPQKNQKGKKYIKKYKKYFNLMKRFVDELDFVEPKP